MAPEPAHKDTSMATIGTEIGFAPAFNRESTRSSVPGGITLRRKVASTWTTDCAFARMSRAVSVVSIGKRDSRKEYAAPLAMPKQLSS